MKRYQTQPVTLKHPSSPPAAAVCHPQALNHCVKVLESLTHPVLLLHLPFFCL